MALYRQASATCRASREWCRSGVNFPFAAGAGAAYCSVVGVLGGDWLYMQEYDMRKGIWTRAVGGGDRTWSGDQWPQPHSMHPNRGGCSNGGAAVAMVVSFLAVVAGFGLTTAIKVGRECPVANPVKVAGGAYVVCAAFGVIALWEMQVFPFASAVTHHTEWTAAHVAAGILPAVAAAFRLLRFQAAIIFYL
jgi:hypothetical protein